MRRLNALAIFALFFTLGCYYDVESTLYSEGNCGVVTSALFTTDVLPMLNQQCISCHSAALPSGGIRLDTYSAVKVEADNGRLMGSIRWTSGYSPMPKNGNKFSSCNIDKIAAWISQGALNN
jgi:Planctomycete cytochrome C